MGRHDPQTTAGAQSQQHSQVHAESPAREESVSSALTSSLPRMRMDFLPPLRKSCHGHCGED